MSLRDALLFYGVEFNPDRSHQKILCPLDHERDPSCSLTLTEDSELFFCHSCGQGGDDVTLIQLKEGIDVASAIRRREEITGRSDRPVRESGGRRSPISGKPWGGPRYRRTVPARARRHFAD